MGLLRGTWSFMRYHIVGNRSEQFEDFLDQRLKKFAFSEIAPPTLEKNLGWTSVQNVLDTEFTYAKYKCGIYIIFSLRIDRRSVPASLLKLKIMEEEKRYLAETGKKKLYRHEHEEIKDRIRLDLLTKSPNIPSFHEICWFTEGNTLIFGSFSQKIIEDFEKYFKESFQLTLQPLLPWDSVPGGRETKASSSQLASPPQESPNEYPQPINQPLSWGREFLTWLWFKSEERNGIIDIPEQGAKEIIFLQRLVLAAGDGEYAETVVCQGLHADMKEGKEALRRGKKIKEARLRVSEDASKWEFTFKADLFQFQSLKLPAQSDEGEDDQEGRNIERIYLIEKIIQIMDALFHVFVTLRLSPHWEQAEVPRLEKWLAQ